MSKTYKQKYLETKKSLEKATSKQSTLALSCAVSSIAGMCLGIIFVIGMIALAAQ